MMTHGNHDAWVDHGEQSVSSRATEDRPVTLVNKSPTQSETNEDGEVMLRQENAVHECDHEDANMPIGDLVDVFLNPFIARAYVTPELTDENFSAVENG